MKQPSPSLEKNPNWFPIWCVNRLGIQQSRSSIKPEHRTHRIVCTERASNWFNGVNLMITCQLFKSFSFIPIFPFCSHTATPPHFPPTSITQALALRWLQSLLQWLGRLLQSLRKLLASNILTVTLVITARSTNTSWSQQCCLCPLYSVLV